MPNNEHRFSTGREQLDPDGETKWGGEDWEDTIEEAVEIGIEQAGNGEPGKVRPYTGPTAIPDQDAEFVDTPINFTARRSLVRLGGHLSYSWDFGDGATATGRAAVHTYVELGEYDLTLTVEDTDGNVDTTTRTIEIIETPPEPELTFTITSDTEEGEEPDTDTIFTFDASESESVESELVKYKWIVNGEVEEEGVIAKHKFDELGDHTVELEGCDEYRCNSSSDSVPVGVEFSEDPESAPKDIHEVHDQLLGSGSSSDPYIIRNTHELQAINADTSAYYALGGNIEASNTEKWNEGAGFEPIEDLRNEFDGQEYQIRGLTINRPSTSYVGLFKGTRNSSVIKDLELNNVTVVGRRGVGALGGSRDYRSRSSFGDVYRVGVRNSTIKAGSGEHIGGLVGRTNNSDIRECWVSGGEVDTNGEQVGGLIGRTTGSTDVIDCYANVAVSGNGIRVGGIVGTTSQVNSTLKNIYSAGAVTNGGGLIGAEDSTDSFENAYWDIDNSGQTSSDGDVEGLRFGQMRGSDAKENMEFSWGDRWDVLAGYPFLKNNPE